MGLYSPDGSSVSVAGSTTSGLQECLNALNSAKLGNFRALCPDPALGTYLATSTTVTFGPSEGCFTTYADVGLSDSFVARYQAPLTQSSART